MESEQKGMNNLQQTESGSTRKVWLNEVSFMRPILLVLLVSYHAFAPFVGTWPMPDSVHDVEAYRWLGLLSRAFRLEGFVFISGYIFTFQIVERKKFDSFSSLLTSKIQRLLIPSFIFSIAYLLLFGKYTGVSSTVVKILSGVGHLWYLPCLFYCFLIQYLLLTFKLKQSYCIAILSVMLLASAVHLPFNLHMPLYYMTFFYGGGMFWKHSEELTNRATWKNVAIAWVVFAVLFIVVNLGIMWMTEMKATVASPLLRGGINEFNTISKAILGWSGVIALYLLAAKYCTHHTIGNFILKVGVCGYGVYVFHQFILVYLYRYTELPNVVGTYMLPWVGIVITIVLSVLLTLSVRSTKVGRKYL